MTTANKTGILNGKVAVITGGSHGIGAATARLFVEEGACVVIADVQATEGQNLADELGEAAVFYSTDVSKEPEVAAAVDLAVLKFGQLDIMMNNAGVMGALGPIDLTNMEHAERTIAINFVGVLNGMKHAARIMKPRGSGVILSTSSPAAVMGGVGPHVYSGTKAAIIGLNNSVAAELRKLGIRANVLIPGAVVSQMTASIVADNPHNLSGATEVLLESAYMDRPLVPEDLAQAALFLASDNASHITGIALPVDAGMTGAGGPAPFGSGRFANPSALFEAGKSEPSA